MLVDQRAARAGVRIFKLGVLGSQQLGNYCHVMVHRKLSFFYLSTHFFFLGQVDPHQGA
jgi:hypothetical protein